MIKSTFHISKMDCLSEERLIRMKLEPVPDIAWLEFDIPNRRLIVYHTGEPALVDQTLQELNLGSVWHGSVSNASAVNEENFRVEAGLLWKVLLINFLCFVLELIYGFVSDSMGLVADSLDMLADAIVYGLSLLAIGHITAKKRRVARISGYFQGALAVLGFIEVLRRFFGIEEAPGFLTMIVISLIALAGNAVSLYLLQRTQSRDAHIQASLIFTSNDVLVNIGVILAGVLVFLTGSKYPDLIVGAVVFVIVGRAALRILKL